MAEKAHNIIGTKNTKTFIGKDCKRSHGGERYIKSRACVLCLSENKQEYYLKNKAKINARNNAYYAANADRVSEYGHIYRKENADAVRQRAAAYRSRTKDKMSEYQREYYQKNKDKVDTRHRNWRVVNSHREAAGAREWRKANPGKSYEYTKKWVQKYPEKRSSYMAKRRAAKSGLSGSHTASQIKEMYRDQNMICACCDRSIKQEDGGYHIDHIMPLALGGTNDIANIQLLTPFCNLSKGAKHPDEWRGTLNQRKAFGPAARDAT
jgi:hypothetical protein